MSESDPKNDDAPGGRDEEWALIEKAWAEFTDTPSERVLAIVGTSLIDRLLGHILRQRFRPNSKTVDNMLGRRGGLLLDISAKADVAYAIAAIERPEFTAIQHIYAIRNLFAHDIEVSFASPAVDKEVKQLTLIDGKTHYPNFLTDAEDRFEIPVPRDNRERFLFNLRACAFLLLRTYLRRHKGGDVAKLALGTQELR